MSGSLKLCRAPCILWQYQSVVAKAYAMNKQFDKAVATQEEVVKAATGPMKDRETKALEDYKAKAEKK